MEVKSLENLYDILGISLEADEKEIKKAYVTMIRKYPPEKAPEEFKKIRKAFEVLINSNSRAEYIARLQYGSDIEELEKVANEAVDNGDYALAINQYKKILIIEPTMSFAKNSLALALIYNGQADEGIEELLELVRENPKNSTYLGNLAYAYKQNEDLEKAEENFIKALEIDSTDERNLSTLMDIYISKEEYLKAAQYLQKGIESNSTEDFREFIYYYEIVHIHTHDNDVEAIKETIDQVIKVMPEDEELKDYISWKFYNLANDLYKSSIFNLAAVITEKIMKLDEENRVIINLYEECIELDHLVQEFRRLDNDGRIIRELKHPIFCYLYRFRFSNKEFEESVKENLKDINERILSDRKNIAKYMQIFIKEYPDLYELKKELYDDIYARVSNFKK
jgi:tetratricopeptide (TPR) repeat protein